MASLFFLVRGGGDGWGGGGVRVSVEQLMVIQHMYLLFYLQVFLVSTDHFLFVQGSYIEVTVEQT